jgi:multiple antibiotic resistance protein
LYLLALINPVSKVAMLVALPPERRHDRFLFLAAKSSGIALVILVVAMVVGDFLLRSVFRVDLYSLRFAGGAVVAWFGLNALRRGVFFETPPHQGFDAIALVPLACPMIAGPATIAAGIGLRAEHGLWIPLISMCLAIGINYVIMILSSGIGRLLKHANILGAIIRITGLIVMTIGTQMMFDGIAGWMRAQGRGP